MATCTTQHCQRAEQLAELDKNPFQNLFLLIISSNIRTQFWQSTSKLLLQINITRNSSNKKSRNSVKSLIWHRKPEVIVTATFDVHNPTPSFAYPCSDRCFPSDFCNMSNRSRSLDNLCSATGENDERSDTTNQDKVSFE